MNVFTSVTEQLLNSIDFTFMLAVNVLTYLVIKLIDNLNGERAVPTYCKRIIAVIVGIALFYAAVSIEPELSKIRLLYSFILSLVSWDILFKPILNHFKKFNYNEDKDK